MRAGVPCGIQHRYAWGLLGLHTIELAALGKLFVPSHVIMPASSAIDRLWWRLNDFLRQGSTPDPYVKSPFLVTYYPRCDLG
ncbi:MAG: hypothetical protein RLZZ140_748 [Pseudomonadota bacterium]